jgi:hypothetical protein
VNSGVASNDNLTAPQKQDPFVGAITKGLSYNLWLLMENIVGGKFEEGKHYFGYLVFSNEKDAAEPGKRLWLRDNREHGLH